MFRPSDREELAVRIFGFCIWHRHTPGERAILAKLGEIMSKIDDIEAAVANQSTVIDSAITLLTELKTELEEALDDEDGERLQAIVDGLGEKTNALAAAVTANTPVAGTPGEGSVPPASDVPTPPEEGSEA